MSNSTYPYLLIGGGMAADAAARGIRKVDPQGAIAMISAEVDPPYNRPPLSKGLWKKGRLERIWRQTEKQGVELFLGRRVEQLLPAEKRLVDDRGEEYRYEKLLLATGGDPIRLPFQTSRVIYYRTLQDYYRLRDLTGQYQRCVVIGGGFIGSELAAALVEQGKEVSLVFMERGIGGRLFPASLSNHLNQVYREKGVRVLPGQLVSAVEELDEEIVIRTQSGEELRAEIVVAGLGIRPNLDLARQAGIEIENGIRVGSDLQTSQPGIYAAGDVISFYNPALQRWMRVEHEEHANQSGLQAGMAMAGAEVNYTLLPSAYSDLFHFGYESVGVLDPALQVIEDWAEPFQKGVLYYLDQGRVRGVLLWNVWGKTDQARELIAAPEKVDPGTLPGRIKIE